MASTKSVEIVGEKRCMHCPQYLKTTEHFNIWESILRGSAKFEEASASSDSIHWFEAIEELD